MKRYCQTLKLRDNKELIDQYIAEHQHVWPEIKASIKEVGIINMDIYIHENTLFMVVDTIDDFDWDRDMARLSTLPRQQEWETYMAKFQDASPESTSAERWIMMKQIFTLD